MFRHIASAKTGKYWKNVLKLLQRAQTSAGNKRQLLHHLPSKCGTELIKIFEVRGSHHGWSSWLHFKVFWGRLYHGREEAAAPIGSLLDSHKAGRFRAAGGGRDGAMKGNPAMGRQTEGEGRWMRSSNRGGGNRKPGSPVSPSATYSPSLENTPSWEMY